MDIKGSKELPISRAEVWKALYDADLLREAIPGCETLEWTSDSELSGRLNLKIGPVKAKFDMVLTIGDVVEEVAYTLNGSAKAGALGFANGQARVELADVEEGCELSYDAEVKTGGKIAQVGSRLMGGITKKLMDTFFSTFVSAVNERASANKT